MSYTNSKHYVNKEHKKREVEDDITFTRPLSFWIYLAGLIVSHILFSIMLTCILHINYNLYTKLDQYQTIVQSVLIFIILQIPIYVIIFIWGFIKSRKIYLSSNSLQAKTPLVSQMKELFFFILIALLISIPFYIQMIVSWIRVRNMYIWTVHMLYFCLWCFRVENYRKVKLAYYLLSECTL